MKKHGGKTKNKIFALNEVLRMAEGMPAYIAWGPGSGVHCEVLRSSHRTTFLRVWAETARREVITRIPTREIASVHVHPEWTGDYFANVADPKRLRAMIGRGVNRRARRRISTPSEHTIVVDRRGWSIRSEDGSDYSAIAPSSERTREMTTAISTLCRSKTCEDLDRRGFDPCAVSLKSLLNEVPDKQDLVLQYIRNGVASGRYVEDEQIIDLFS